MGTGRALSEAKQQEVRASTAFSRGGNPALAPQLNPATLTPHFWRACHNQRLGAHTLAFNTRSRVKPSHWRFHSPPTVWAALICLVLCACADSFAAEPIPATRPTSIIPSDLSGRKVEEVRILARPRPLGASLQGEVLHQIRTKEGDRFDPSIVEGDYQRIYGLKKFSNVEARIEPTT